MCPHCLTSCCPCRGAPAQAPRQRQHEVRQWDTHDNGSAAIRGVPLPNPPTQHRQWSSDGKGNTSGATVGAIMDHWGVSPCWINPSVGKVDHHNDTNTPRNTTEPYPQPPTPPRSSGVTNVGPTTAIATHNLTGPLCPTKVATPLASAVHQAPHRDGVDMPDACLHPHREAMHTQHTEPGPSYRGPFSDPHVHKVTQSIETKQECNHSSANTLGPVHHVARTHQADDKSKERKKEGVHEQRVLCEG